MIKVSGLRHKRAYKIDPGISWIIIQKIYLMHQYIDNKEESNTDMLITSMSEH